MKLSKSKNLKIFKNEIGQANHFLITILVGLDGVHDNKINIKEEFSTSWNPKNRIDSANRSREFAKKSALTSISCCFVTIVPSGLITTPPVVSLSTIENEVEKLFPSSVNLPLIVQSIPATAVAAKDMKIKNVMIDLNIKHSFIICKLQKQF